MFIIKNYLSILLVFFLSFSFVVVSPKVYAADSTKNSVQHVLLVSIDGLHASDLANYIQNNPHSNLAVLSNHGINYTKAMGSKPSDSFPGLLALLTGGSPNSTGVFYDESYDRNLLPPLAKNAGDQVGTDVIFDESIAYDSNTLDGGGSINPNSLPRDPITKQPVYPHNYVRVNNIFSVVKAAGKRTAWVDKHLAYDLITGPSGSDVDDLYTPEIGAGTKNVVDTESYDDLKIAAILNEINGKDHSGTKTSQVPTLFGMNFQAVSVGQKFPGNGYQDSLGNFSNGLKDAMDHTDQSIGIIVDELKKQNLYNSTVIIITAKHGQSPIDPAKLKFVNKKLITEGVPAELIAQMTTDDIALIWLTDQTKVDSVLATIEKNKEQANIKDIYSFSKINPQWMYNNPATDSRVPDIIIQPNDGVIYSKPGKKIAEHGGFSADDSSVALLVSFAKLNSAQQNDTVVQTTQVAPTILTMLGLNPEALQAVQIENTKALPGLDLLK